MKTSQFNLFYKKKNCVMGYNSYTDSFMLMSHKAYEAYKTVKLSDFEKQYPDIYRKLEDMKSLAHAQIPPHTPERCHGLRAVVPGHGVPVAENESLSSNNQSVKK